MPEVAVPGETPQPTNTEESKKLRRGRPPKAEKAATEKQNKNAVYCFMNKSVPRENIITFIPSQEVPSSYGSIALVLLNFCVLSHLLMPVDDFRWTIAMIII